MVTHAKPTSMWTVGDGSATDVTKYAFMVHEAAGASPGGRLLWLSQVAMKLRAARSWQAVSLIAALFALATTHAPPRPSSMARRADLCKRGKQAI